MTRHPPRPILCALMCMAFVLAIMLLSGCASAPTSWPAARTELWPDSALPCDPQCQT